MNTRTLIALSLAAATYTGAAVAAGMNPATPASPATVTGTTVNTTQPSMGNTGPATTQPLQNRNAPSPQVIGGQTNPNSQNTNPTTSDTNSMNRKSSRNLPQSGTTSPTRIDETGRVTHGSVPNAPGNVGPDRR